VLTLTGKQENNEKKDENIELKHSKNLYEVLRILLAFFVTLFICLFIFFAVVGKCVAIQLLPGECMNDSLSNLTYCAINATNITIQYFNVTNYTVFNYTNYTYFNVSCVNETVEFLKNETTKLLEELNCTKLYAECEESRKSCVESLKSCNIQNLSLYVLKSDYDSLKSSFDSLKMQSEKEKKDCENLSYQTALIGFVVGAGLVYFMFVRKPSYKLTEKVPAVSEVTFDQRLLEKDAKIKQQEFLIEELKKEIEDLKSSLNSLKRKK
jgi:hypothetical protein